METNEGKKQKKSKKKTDDNGESFELLEIAQNRDERQKHDEKHDERQKIVERIDDRLWYINRVWKDFKCSSPLPHAEFMWRVEWFYNTVNRMRYFTTDMVLDPCKSDHTPNDWEI